MIGSNWLDLEADVASPLVLHHTALMHSRYDCSQAMASSRTELEHR